MAIFYLRLRLQIMDLWMHAVCREFFNFDAAHGALHYHRCIEWLHIWLWDKRKCAVVLIYTRWPLIKGQTPSIYVNKYRNVIYNKCLLINTNWHSDMEMSGHLWKDLKYFEPVHDMMYTPWPMSIKLRENCEH